MSPIYVLICNFFLVVKLKGWGVHVCLGIFITFIFFVLLIHKSYSFIKTSTIKPMFTISTAVNYTNTTEGL